MQPRVRTYKQKITRYWRWLVSKDIVVFLVFVGIVTTFWWGHSMSSLRDETIRIQVNYNGVADRIAFTTPLPKYLDVHIRDKGRQLRQLVDKQLTVTINVTELFKSKEGSIVLTADMLHSQLQNVLPGTTTILEVQPQRIESEYVYQSEKKVPIILRAKVNSAPQHFLTNEPELFMDSISIFGSDQALRKVNYIYTDSLILNNLKNDTIKAVPLQIPANIRAIQTQVKVKCFAEQYTELTYDIPIQVIDKPYDEEVRLFPKPTTKVTVQVGFSNHTKVKKEDFTAICRYPKQVSDVLPIEIETTSPYVSNIRIYPSSVEYIIEKKHEKNSNGRSADAVPTH